MQWRIQGANPAPAMAPHTFWIYGLWLPSNEEKVIISSGSASGAYAWLVFLHRDHQTSKHFDCLYIESGDVILILITAVLYSAPSRKSTQERSQPNLGQKMWS